MKKFTTYKEKQHSEENIEIFVDKLLKENLSLEISGIESPWRDEIDFTSNPKLIESLKDYIDKEINKSNLALLSKIQVAFYQNDTLNILEEEMIKLNKKLK